MNDQIHDILLNALKQGHTQRFIKRTTKWVRDYYERSLNFLQKYLRNGVLKRITRFRYQLFDCIE